MLVGPDWAVQDSPGWGGRVKVDERGRGQAPPPSLVHLQPLVGLLQLKPQHVNLLGGGGGG